MASGHDAHSLSHTNVYFYYIGQKFYKKETSNGMYAPFPHVDGVSS